MANVVKFPGSKDKEERREVYAMGCPQCGNLTFAIFLEDEELTIECAFCGSEMDSADEQRH